LKTYEQRRQRDPNEPFTGALATKTKADLQDIAHALELTIDGQKKDLLARLNAHFDENSILLEDPRFGSQLPLHELPYLASLTSIQGPKSEIRVIDTDTREFSNMFRGFRWGPRINTFSALLSNSDNTFESRFPCSIDITGVIPSVEPSEIGASTWAQGRASDSLLWIHLRRSRPASVKTAVQTRYKILLYSARCGYIYCIMLS
jgi:hypothetical protein